MKNLYFISLAIVTLLIISAFSNSEVDIKSDARGGIQFFKGSFQEALDKAKAENKPIFLDVYATWCGPCKMLKKRTFSDKNVGDYYNANFINIAINGETEEGYELSKLYDVKGYPTLLIIDKNGRKLTKQVGFVEPYILINFGKRIVP